MSKNKENLAEGSNQSKDCCNNHECCSSSKESHSECNCTEKDPTLTLLSTLIDRIYITDPEALIRVVNSDKQTYTVSDAKSGVIPYIMYKPSVRGIPFNSIKTLIHIDGLEGVEPVDWYLPELTIQSDCTNTFKLNRIYIPGTVEWIMETLVTSLQEAVSSTDNYIRFKLSCLDSAGHSSIPMTIQYFRSSEPNELITISKPDSPLLELTQSLSNCVYQSMYNAPIYEFYNLMGNQQQACVYIPTIHDLGVVMIKSYQYVYPWLTDKSVLKSYFEVSVD